MNITLDLPDDIGLRLLKDPAQCMPAVWIELAVALYREGKLPPGRAAQVAGMDRWDFEELLVERKIPFPRSDESLLQEIKDALRHCP